MLPAKVSSSSSSGPSPSALAVRSRRVVKSHPHLAFYIDAGAGDIARAMRELARPAGTFARVDSLRQRVESEWTRLAHGPLAYGVESDSIATLSVRTGLDLFLRVSSFKPGSVVLMTAINIPDMVKIVEHHGLVPVPVDIEVDTLAPTEESLRSTIAACERHNGEPPVAILVAHVYGRRSVLDDVISIAAEKGMQVIEDCAEAFSGLEYLGDSRADISLFSFGGIKYNTAFGGGMMRVRDRKLRLRMKERYAQYPVQKKWDYMKRVVKYGATASCIDYTPWVYTWMTCFRAMGVSENGVQNTFIGLLRGFDPATFFMKLRHRPCEALLATLLSRTTRFDARRFKRGMENLDWAASELHSALEPCGVIVPGIRSAARGHWLFPLLVEGDAAKLINALQAHGVWAHRSTTQLRVVKVPPAMKGAVPTPHNAHRVIDNVVYIPLHYEVPAQNVRRLVAIVKEVCLVENAAASRFPLTRYAARSRL